MKKEQEHQEVKTKGIQAEVAEMECFGLVF
jgi:hypothetical protein